MEKLSRSLGLSDDITSVMIEVILMKDNKMAGKPQRFRILLIEDNIDRINIFRSWIPESALLTVVSSAGSAMGMLKRDNNKKNGRVYSGILLDHDLQEQAITAQDTKLSSTNLIGLIIENIENNVPILIHSMNPAKSIEMQRRLETSNFTVTLKKWTELEREKAAFDSWLGYCYELWKDFSEEG